MPLALQVEEEGAQHPDGRSSLSSDPTVGHSGAGSSFFSPRSHPGATRTLGPLGTQLGFWCWRPRPGLVKRTGRFTGGGMEENQQRLLASGHSLRTASVLGDLGKRRMLPLAGQPTAVLGSRGGPSPVDSFCRTVEDSRFPGCQGLGGTPELQGPVYLAPSLGSYLCTKSPLCPRDLAWPFQLLGVIAPVLGDSSLAPVWFCCCQGNYKPCGTRALELGK